MPRIFQLKYPNHVTAIKIAVAYEINVGMFVQCRAVAVGVHDDDYVCVCVYWICFSSFYSSKIYKLMQISANIFCPRAFSLSLLSAYPYVAIRFVCLHCIKYKSNRQQGRARKKGVKKILMIRKLCMSVAAQRHRQSLNNRASNNVNSSKQNAGI